MTEFNSNIHERGNLMVNFKKCLAVMLSVASIGAITLPVSAAESTQTGGSTSTTATATSDTQTQYKNISDTYGKYINISSYNYGSFEFYEDENGNEAFKQSSDWSIKQDGKTTYIINRKSVENLCFKLSSNTSKVGKIVKSKVEFYNGNTPVTIKRNSNNYYVLDTIVTKKYGLKITVLTSGGYQITRKYTIDNRLGLKYGFATTTDSSGNTVYKGLYQIPGRNYNILSPYMIDCVDMNLYPKVANINGAAPDVKTFSESDVNKHYANFYNFSVPTGAKFDIGGTNIVYYYAKYSDYINKGLSANWTRITSDTVFETGTYAIRAKKYFKQSDGKYTYSNIMYTPYVSVQDITNVFDAKEEAKNYVIAEGIADNAKEAEKEVTQNPQFINQALSDWGTLRNSSGQLFKNKYNYHTFLNIDNFHNDMISELNSTSSSASIMHRCLGKFNLATTSFKIYYAEGENLGTKLPDGQKYVRFDTKYASIEDLLLAQYPELKVADDNCNVLNDKRNAARGTDKYNEYYKEYLKACDEYEKQYYSHKYSIFVTYKVNGVSRYMLFKNVTGERL